MRSKVNNKFIFISLLLCALFLTSYIGLFFPVVNGTDLWAAGGDQSSSMTSRMNFGLSDCLAAPGSAAGISGSSSRPVRLFGTKTNFNLYIAIIPVLTACLIIYARSSKLLSIQLFSGTVTIFLHNKDGKK